MLRIIENISWYYDCCNSKPEGRRKLLGGGGFLKATQVQKAVTFVNETNLSIPKQNCSNAILRRAKLKNRASGTRKHCNPGEQLIQGGE